MEKEKEELSEFEIREIEREKLFEEEEEKGNIFHYRKSVVGNIVFKTIVLAIAIAALTYLVCVGYTIYVSLFEVGKLHFSEGDLPYWLYLYPLAFIFFEAILLGVIIGLEFIIGYMYIGKAERRYYEVRRTLSEKGYSKNFLPY